MGADVRSGPLSDHRVTTTVSWMVMALVLPSVQGGGASTRTNLAVRTDQIRGTHELQCVQGCLIVQQLPYPLLCSGEC